MGPTKSTTIGLMFASAIFYTGCTECLSTNECASDEVCWDGACSSKIGREALEKNEFEVFERNQSTANQTQTDSNTNNNSNNSNDESSNDTEDTSGTQRGLALQLDANKVYVSVSLDDLGQYPVICDAEDPDEALAAFTLGPNFTIIRPTDNVLIYTELRKLYAFVPDGYVERQGDLSYPENPHENDTSLPVAPCSMDDSNESVSEFRIHPGTGEVIHRCKNNAVEWYDSSGQVFSGCGPELGDRLSFGYVLKHIGVNGTRLCHEAVASASGERFPITPLTVFNSHSPRAKPDGGFWVVTGLGDTPYQRWTISETGIATLEGTYAVWDQRDTVDEDFDIRLDADGNLYENVGIGTAQGVLKYSADFQTATLVHLGNDRLCKYNFLRLLTGP